MLQKIKIIDHHIQVIIITGYSDVRVAVEALKKGAFEYVTKPLYPDEILLTIKNALSQNSKQVPALKPQVRSQGRTQRSSDQKFVKGASHQSKTVQKHIELIAPTDMSVIIHGETGTGKEYVARAIHQHSQRSTKPFVALDCGALPGDLAGSELFGHVKGAFTGAIADKQGCFEQADGGTLFLDEIGNLSYDNQVKLLRILQERTVKRLGGIKDIPIDVRLIVATNEDLKKKVQASEFREDIYHRLNEFKIDIAPLRERNEDIEVFANHFLALSNSELGKSVTGFEDIAIGKLKNYTWHGNLRELRNVIKRAVLLSQNSKIDSSSLPQEIWEPSARDDKKIEISFNGGVPGSLKEVSEQAEKHAIISVLRLTNNNKTKTAEMLEVDRKTLYNKLKSFGIDH